MGAVLTHEVQETSLLWRKAGFPTFLPLLNRFIALAILLDVECTADTHSCAEKCTKVEIEWLFVARHAFLFNHMVQEKPSLSQLLLGILDIQGINPSLLLELSPMDPDEG
jgi:hypothetical protein